MTLPAMTLSSAVSGERRVGRDDDAPTGQALADVVVGVADEAQRDAPGTKAPKLWPADPRRVRSMVPSGRPLAWARVTSWPSIVPTVRLTLRTANSPVTGVPSSMASRASGDELVVQGLLEAVVLADRVPLARTRRGCRPR